MGETESNAPIDKAIERFWEIMTEFGKAIDQSNQETNMNLRNKPWHVRVFIIGHVFADRYDNESVFACEYYCSTADNDVLELNDYLTAELDDGYVLADDFVFPSEAPEELIIITECNLDVASSCRRSLGWDYN